MTVLAAPTLPSSCPSPGALHYHWYPNNFALVIHANSGCASISLGLGPLIFGASKDLFARCNSAFSRYHSFLCSFCILFSRVESNFCHLFQLHSRYCIDRLWLADTDTGDVTLRVAIIRGLSLPEHYCRFYCRRASCCCETSSAAARESMDMLGAKRISALLIVFLLEHQTHRSRTRIFP